jgi:GNAT superfamily N-acetyltransferase
LSTLIEPAVAEDAEAILALQKLACQTEAALYGNDIPPLRQTLGELRNDIATGMVLKLIEDGRVIGSVRATIVGRLIVYPAAQRRGFGSMLMAAIEERCTTCRRFELLTGEVGKPTRLKQTRQPHRTTPTYTCAQSRSIMPIGTLSPSSTVSALRLLAQGAQSRLLAASRSRRMGSRASPAAPLMGSQRVEVFPKMVARVAARGAKNRGGP